MEEIRNQNINEERNIRSSSSSINSNPELKDRKVFYLRILLIIINITSLISGFYIMNDRLYYLSPKYNFEYFNTLYAFIMIYSLGMIAALIFSFLLTLIIKIFSCIFNVFKSETLINNEDKLSENSIRYINAHSNDISCIPYTLTIFVISSVVIYFLSLPYSIFILIFLTRNENYSNCKNFSLLYFFIIINTIGGIILFYILIVIISAKRQGSYRKKILFIDEDNLNNLRNEIRGAMQQAEN